MYTKTKVFRDMFTLHSVEYSYAK